MNAPQAKIKHTRKRTHLHAKARVCACVFARVCVCACVRMCVCVRACMRVCMIITSPYRLRHWLRLNDDKRLYYPMQGSVGQLNLQLSVSKSTLHRRKHGESYFIMWRSFKGDLMQHSSPSFTLIQQGRAHAQYCCGSESPDLCKHTHGKEKTARDR